MNSRWLYWGLFLLSLSAPALAAPPVGDLFAPPQYDAAYISPDGEHLALLINDAEDQHIDVLSMKSGEIERIYTIHDTDTKENLIGKLAWIDSQTLIFSQFELKEGIAKLTDTRKSAQLYFVGIHDPDKTLRYLETQGRVHNLLPDMPNQIMFSVPGRSSHLYRIDVSKLHVVGAELPKTALPDGGVFSRNNRVGSVDGLALRWLTTPDGNIHSVITVQPENERIAFLSRSEDEEWVEEKVWEFDKDDDDEDQEIYIPLAPGEREGEYITVIAEGDEEAVYSYNFKTEGKNLVFKPPGNDILSVNFGFDGTTLLEVSYFHEGQIRYHYFKNRHDQTAVQLGEIYPEYTANIISVDQNEDVFIANLTSPVQPGKLVALREGETEPMELLEQMPWIADDSLAKSTVGKVRSGDLMIEYFLTMPAGRGPYPLVVYPHGGPWNMRDQLAFDPLVQLIAKRGFAVLQVNFRGSAGYGQEFADALKGEFGGAVLDDIEAALETVSSRPDVDGARTCVFGYSFGGYAALQLAVRQPMRYRCVVGSSAPLDLPLLIFTQPEDAAAELLELIAGVDELTDDVLVKLRDISPVYNASRIQVPVMLTHGGKDKVVDREHTYRMKQLLENGGNPPVWHFYPEQKHAFKSLREYGAYGEQVVDFLSEHISPVAGSF